MLQNIADRLRLLKYFFSSACRRGLIRTIRIAAYELWFERKFGATTGIVIPVERLDYDQEAQSHAQPYFPSSYLFLHEALVGGPVVCAGQVFIDYGCGMGRALLFASTLPFKRIIGVELSTNLCDAAKSNLAQYYSTRRKNSPPWSVVNADARTFDVPDDATVFYMANPFDAVVVEAVMQNVVASIRAKRRKCYIVYANPQHENILRKLGLERVGQPNSDFVIYTSP
jgi:SAM-dependent methyltransferase